MYGGHEKNKTKNRNKGVGKKAKDQNLLKR
jgi:hypothetical protein